MAGTTEYIESYFQKTLTKEERAAFEARCETDEVFAKDVAFYITARQALREALLAQKQEQWKEDIAEEKEITPVIPIASKPLFGRWITYAAAAVVLLVVSVYLFEVQSSPQRLASNYIKKEFTSLSVTMDASQDSIQLGLEAYNNRDYDKALQLFSGVQKNDPTNSDARKYTGLAYLQQENYEAAIDEFDELAKMEGLFSNPGDFLKAVSFLKRNDPGDEEAARALLEKIVREKEEGSEEAADWLTKF